MHPQLSSIGLLSLANSAFFKLSVPVEVNAVPFRASRVGNTQSNMSMPRAIISSNCGVASERSLDFHRDLRRNKCGRSVDVILKLNALLGNFSQLRQRKNLVTAAVGQNRPVPGHEFVETAEMFDHLNPRPDEEMISVSQNDRRVQFAQFARAHRLNTSLRPYRHERRCFNRAMRRR